jgi:hypothetical protein
LDSIQAAAGVFLVAGVLVLPTALLRDDLSFLMAPWGMLIFGEEPTVWVIGSLGLLILALILTINFRRDQDAANGQ